MFPPLRPIAPQLAGRRAAALRFLASHSGTIVCALFLLAGLALAGDYGVNYDEQFQRQIARGNLDYILGRADHIATFYYHDRVYGAAFELALLLAEEAVGLEDAYSVNRFRLTLIYLSFIGGAYFCYRLAHNLFGSRRIALLALLIFLLHPRLYAHAFFNSKDLPFLNMLVIALYLLERAFRRDTLGAFALLGIAVGLLTNLRIMGLMLLAAPLLMRGLDWFYAKTGPERKHILLTAGLFGLTAVLTLYALSPYAWTNPVDYLVTNLVLTVNHPSDPLPQLFQGEWELSTEQPLRYIPVWMGITTPPLILLLGFIGMAAVLARGLAHPQAVFRNTRLRFGLLLLACGLLPPLAAALLGSVQYDNWRHLYFIYGPFTLLAAGGGGWLAAGLARRPWQIGAYTLAAAGFGLILLQMAQLHPLQYDYFNFLVDRVTPERLRRQYGMDPWRFTHRAGLEYMLNRHPGETLGVRVQERYLERLRPADRQRLERRARQADYALNSVIDRSQPDLAFNSAYRRPYRNTLTDLRPLTAERMEPAAIAAYRELYRQALAKEPLIRADYNVYLDGKRLAFVRENCAPEEPDSWFGARLFPRRPETLPPELRQRGSYALFENYGVRLGQLCLAFIQLPDYAAGDLILQRRDYGAAADSLWSDLYSLSQPGLGELIADYRRNRPQSAGPEDFAVFIDREAGRNRLIYAKGDCSWAEYQTRVTLHIYPESPGDLPFYLWPGGLDNRDFWLNHYGGRPGGECIAAVPLPAYPIAAIRTGQAGAWEVNLQLATEPDRLRAVYRELADRNPDFNAVFDLYRRNNRLVYLRETCNPADRDAGFFLHIIPEEVAHLPAERRSPGFANRDFAFDQWGGAFDGKCLATVPLPAYPIKTIRTGQYVPGQGELWAAELTAGR